LLFNLALAQIVMCSLCNTRRINPLPERVALNAPDVDVANAVHVHVLDRGSQLFQRLAVLFHLVTFVRQLQTRTD
jgi:hypothetical protein